ncbi:MAG: 3'-5' exonuclease [Pseudomonadota bacterium]|nr:3'-5' exonuclease [Pseudomonadota bacterium]
MAGERIAVIDFETTGLSPDMGDRATEVAVVVIDNGRVVEQFQSLMNAGVGIPSFIEALTGITDAMVRKAPPAAEVMRELARFIGDIPLVAHNASFDRKFLDAELSRARRRRQQDFTCSMRVARRIYPRAPNHKLGTLVEYAGVPVKGRYHRALADAEMTANLWLAMQEEICRKHRLAEVPLELMNRLQSIPRYSLDSYVTKYRKRHDL